MPGLALFGHQRWLPARARPACCRHPQRNRQQSSCWAPCGGALLQVKTALLVAGLGAMGADPSDGKKVLLIVNEPNEKVYLSGRNIPTLAINTSHAVQVRRSDAVRGGSGLSWAGAGMGAPDGQGGSGEIALQFVQPGAAAAGASGRC